jgi:hypothetical protein
MPTHPPACPSLQSTGKHLSTDRQTPSLPSASTPNVPVGRYIHDKRRVVASARRNRPNLCKQARCRDFGRHTKKARDSSIRLIPSHRCFAHFPSLGVGSGSQVLACKVLQSVCSVHVPGESSPSRLRLRSARTRNESLVARLLRDQTRESAHAGGTSSLKNRLFRVVVRPPGVCDGH